VVEKVLLVVASGALVWAASNDFKTKQVPAAAGFGMLAIGAIFLSIGKHWLPLVFYLAAIWGSRGGIWRALVFVLAILVVGQGGLGVVPLVMGILYALSIFWLGWFGGGDAQLAFGLVALGQDWWILGYIFGGTILLAGVLLIVQRGFGGAAKRIQHVVANLNSPDEEVIRVPWAVIAALGGIVHIWLWPGVIWQQ
jgi:hypothetical protein